MSKIRGLLTTTVAIKLFMGLSGVALIGFIVAHLAGNLTLYASTSLPFNTYAAGLDRLGYLKLAGEIGLIGLFGGHVILAFLLKRNHKKARPLGYFGGSASKGIETSNLASRNMIITGLVLLGFLILHIKQFRFGPSFSEGYVTIVNGENARDLHRVIVETFKRKLNVGIYVFVMLVLGVHLRHGIWSAFQSIGVLTPGWSRILHIGAALLSILLVVGFLFIPVYIYFGNFRGG